MTKLLQMISAILIDYNGRSLDFSSFEEKLKRVAEYLEKQSSLHLA